MVSSNATYIKITIRGLSLCGGTSTTDVANGDVLLKAQIKETGGAYGDILAYASHFKLFKPEYQSVQSGASFTIYGTLTAGQKTNGYQIKLFSSSIASTACTAAFTNVQTVLEEAD